MMGLRNVWNAEPVAIVNAVRLCALAAMAFGLNLTPTQLLASMTALEAVLTLFTRAQTTSPATLQAMTPQTLATAQDASQPVKDTVRKLPVVVLACVLGMGSVTLPACTPPATIVTDPGKAAYRADQVIQRLQEFSNVVKDSTGTKPGQIRPLDAYVIIEWVSGDDKAHPPTIGIAQLVAKDAGQGWKMYAKDSWNARIKAVLQRYPALDVWVPIIGGLLEVI